MSVFKLEAGKVARELRVVVLEDPDDFDARTEDMPPGVHVVDILGNNLIVLSNKNMYKQSGSDENVWLPLRYGPDDNSARVRGVSKVVVVTEFHKPRVMILLEDQRTLWGTVEGARYDYNGIFNAHDPVVDIAPSGSRPQIHNKYYPMLANVAHKFLPPGVKITGVSWLEYACCAGMSNGTILVWGRVNLKVVQQQRRLRSGGLKILSVPGTRPGDEVVSLASDERYIVWVVKHKNEPGGRVCVYGNNVKKQCGIAGIAFCEPTRITAIPELVKSVACGLGSSFALTVDGHIFVWGAGYGNELGTVISTSDGILPTKIFPPRREEGAIWLRMACGQSSIALYGSTKNEIWGVATWGELGGGGRLEKVSREKKPPRDIDFSPELMELLFPEHPKFVNLVTLEQLVGENYEPHIIFTRDDFNFQEFGEFDVEERLEFGEESGMYKQVRRRR